MTDRETAPVAVVVAAGRNVDGVPVGVNAWAEVRQRVENVVGLPGDVFTRDAVGIGEWEGEYEESVTVAGEVRPARLGWVLDEARRLATDHSQDAVAVTVGVTVLVGSGLDYDSPYRIAARLRDLADDIEHLRY